MIPKFGRLTPSLVTPAKAWIHPATVRAAEKWIPAFAGMTSLNKCSAKRLDQHTGRSDGRRATVRVHDCGRDVPGPQERFTSAPQPEYVIAGGLLAGRAGRNERGPRTF